MLRYRMRYIVLLLMLLFAACSTQDEQSVVHVKSSAEINLSKELASIDSNRQIQLSKIEQNIELKKLANSLEIEMASVEEEYLYKRERNLFLLSAFLILVLAVGLYLLLKYRHDNKQKSYNDNLKKYFQQQELLSRMKLAEKIIDKISDGKTPSQQEQRLIEILRDVNKKPDQETLEDATKTTKPQKLSNSPKNLLTS